MLALHDPAHCAAQHGLAKRYGRKIALMTGGSESQIWIERQPESAQQSLPCGRTRHRFFYEFEILGPQLT
jgi:hypothetical protein